MKLILALLIFIGTVYSSELMIVTDNQFTNQDYTFKQYLSFYTNFPNYRLNYSQKEVLYRASRIQKINVLVILAKLQNESDLLFNYSKDRYEWRVHRAMGYGMIRHWWEGERQYKFYKYGGFDIQVYFAGELLRKSFDKWDGKKEIKLFCRKANILPKNRATFSLYVYNPFYGTHTTYGYKSTGNKLFETYFSKISEIWIEHLK